MNVADQSMLHRWTQQGDAEAFAGIVQAHSGMVYATCRRILGNAADAEDAAQECFLKLAQATPRIRTSLVGWLHTLATHTAINRIRSDARRREREVRYSLQHSEAVEVEWDDLAPIIDETIVALPEKLRYPVIAHFLEGETHRSIAGKLRLDQSTVTRRIHKGLEEIRKSLRRRGVAVVSSALGALLVANAAEAAPAAITASLGKIAIASVAPHAATTGTATTLIGGALLMKSKLTAVSLAIALLLGLSIYSSRTIQPPPEDLAALPAESVNETDTVESPTVSSDTDPAATQDTDSLNAATNSAGVTGVKSFVDKSLLGSISGNVLDPRDVLPEGARVHATKQGVEDNEATGRHRSLIDDMNRFEMTGIQAGVYTVYIIPGNISPGERGQNEVVLEPGESITDLALLFDDLHAVTGRMTDENGNLVDGADITGDWGQIFTRTTQRGDYAVMFHDDPRLYNLYASHEDFRGDSRIGVARGDRNVDFVLTKKIEFTVQGVVRRADTREPVSSYEMRWSQLDTPTSSLFQLSDGFYTPVNDPEGRFELPVNNLHPWDEYGAVIAVRAPHFAPVATTVSFTHSGQIVQNLEILLHPGKVIEGIVRTDAGKPIAGANVYQGPLRDVYIYPDYSEVDSTYRSLATTASDGSFRIDTISPEGTLLVVHHRDFAPSWVELTPTRIASSKIEVTLLEGAVIQASIYQNGEAPAGTSPGERIYFPDHPAFDFFYLRGQQEEHGTYSFSHLPLGEAKVGWQLGYRLETADPRNRSVTANVYHRLRVPAYLENERTTELNFNFERGSAVLEGTALIDGRWPSGGRVIVRPRKDSDIDESFYARAIQETGYYRLEGLPGGPATVEVTSAGRGESDPWTRIAVELRDGFVTTQDIVINSGEVPAI